MERQLTVYGIRMGNVLRLLISLEFIIEICIFCIKHEVKCKAKANAAVQRIPSVRFDWAEFKDSLSQSQFLRMFRMNKEDFDLLCERIILTDK